MDARNPRWPPSRSAPSRRPVRVIAALLALPCAAGLAAASGRYELHATLQSTRAVPSAAGYAVQATLTPSRQALHGGGFAVEAVAAPADACSGGGDLIFANGFDVASR